jgi:hypothetical protein
LKASGRSSGQPLSDDRKDSSMNKYLILYRSPITAAEQMAQATPEQAQAGMDAWNAWAAQVGDAVVDMGSPLNVVEAGGDTGTPVGGYSILQAESADDLARKLEGHPHLAMGGTIQSLEFLPMPGM